MIMGAAMHRLLIVLAASIAPGLEPRYAFPLGLALGLSPAETLLACLSGLFLLALILPRLVSSIDTLFRRLSGGRLGRVAGLYYLVVESARRRAGRIVEEYRLLGLILFIAAPLPVTGMWTGALAAHLLGLDSGKTSAALLAGGLASLAVTAAASLGVETML